MRETYNSQPVLMHRGNHCVYHEGVNQATNAMTNNSTAKNMTTKEIQSKYWVIQHAWYGSSAILWYDTMLEAQCEAENKRHHNTGVSYEARKGVF